MRQMRVGSGWSQRVRVWHWVLRSDSDDLGWAQTGQDRRTGVGKVTVVTVICIRRNSFGSPGSQHSHLHMNCTLMASTTALLHQQIDPNLTRPSKGILGQQGLPDSAVPCWQILSLASTQEPYKQHMGLARPQCTGVSSSVVSMINNAQFSVTDFIST